MKLLDISKVSIRYQVVVPKEVRDKLGLKEGDKLAWYIDDNGRIFVQKI